MEKKYARIRVVCRNKIKGCEFCKDKTFSDERCKYCGRPLWKQISESCDTIIGYYDNRIGKKRGLEEYIGIDFICRECNSVTSV